jgi:hypothetical protein
MNLRDMDGLNWIDLAQDRDQWKALVNTEMNLRVPYISGKFLSSSTIGGFSRWAELNDVSFTLVSRISNSVT